MTRMQEVKATLRNLQISPRKVRLVADLVRGASVAQAIQQLSVSTKQAARPMAKLLASAVANATHNHGLKQDTLKIKSIIVNHGRTLKRFTPKAFGRATLVRKRASHIEVVLVGEPAGTLTKRTATSKKEATKKTSTTKKAQDKDMEKQVPKKKPAKKKPTTSKKPKTDNLQAKGHERPTQHKKDKSDIVNV